MTLTDLLNQKPVATVQKQQAIKKFSLADYFKKESAKKDSLSRYSDTYPEKEIKAFNYSRPYENGIKHHIKISVQRNNAELDVENKYNVIVENDDEKITLPVEIVEQLACELLNVFDDYNDAHIPKNAWTGKK